LQPPFDITGDLDTPVSAFMKLAAFEPRFLLESVEGGERLARYSFIGFGDALEVRLDDAGLAIGAKVTLRGTRMYEFLDRLISIAMPRIRDFRGVSPRAFDGQGNYSLGVKEQIIFPEIQYDQVDQVRGMDITITTTATDDRHGRALLEAFNFPFRK